MSDKDDMTTSGAVLGVLAIFVSIPVSWALRGWAMADIWTWFIVPLPFGLRALTRPEAFGLYFAATLFRSQPLTDGEDKVRKHLGCDWTQNEKMQRAIVGSLGGPVVAWCVAWLAHSFIGWWWA